MYHKASLNVSMSRSQLVPHQLAHACPQGLLNMRIPYVASSVTSAARFYTCTPA